jgi:crossover junction endodeoxyribonuclease RuvC
MRIVGIDASLTGTGVAVLDGSLRTERIESKLTGPARLFEIRNRVREIVASKTSPSGADLVVIEGYAFAKPMQAHQVGELGGVLRLMLFETGIPWIEVAPSQVKKFATGRGNAKKEEMAVAIFKRFGREFRSNDEADAFVLAVIGQALAGCHFDNLTAFQREVIDELRNPKARRKKAAKKAG